MLAQEGDSEAERRGPHANPHELSWENQKIWSLIFVDLETAVHVMSRLSK